MEEHSKPVLRARIMFPLYSRTARRPFSWRCAGKVTNAGGGCLRGGGGLELGQPWISKIVNAEQS